MRIETHLDYQTILANHACPVHFAIRFQADSVSQPRSQPAAFCLVLDRSGSMAGQPLACAKDAAKVAVRNLRMEDQFALVVFDDEAQTIVPMQAVTNKDAVVQCIEGIQSGGSTNLTGGWMLGRDQMRTSASGATRRLLLLSDGQLNVGIVEPLAVRQVVASGLEQDSIRTSCLGFGSSYNEELMAEMARVTNGQFHDAGSPEKFPAIFNSEPDGLQRLTDRSLG
jgi:Ca-activated chloride channel homolog